MPFLLRSMIGLPLALGAVLLAAPAAAGPVIHIRADQPGAAPTLLGAFIEDINYAGDGGLYPERVKNRSFEFPDPLLGWLGSAVGDATGTLSVRDEAPLHPNNPHYLRITNDAAAEGVSLANEGFFGIGVEQGAGFTFSVYARSAGPAELTLTAEIVGAEGRVLASGRVAGFAAEWERKTCRLRARATDPKARLNLRVSGRGVLDVDMVSLYPRDTFKGRANGLRSDLGDWLEALHPAFLRFPGGCIVEGRTLDLRYQWKTTIGDLPGRKLIVNRWNDEFKHRPAPDYYQSFGLGFYEYFLLAEDIGAEPLPILNCGMACQFNSGELAPLEDLDPYVQDALDLIEFANGPRTSPWGARRVAMGHPQPFHLKYLGVGNEQWGQQYLDRYVRFAEILKARHPEIQLIASAGPQPNDDRYHYLWPRLRELRADIIDEHCYSQPAWFLDEAFRYDAFDRAGPKVFMGEYAAQSVRTVSPENRNNWACALAEAAFLTGLERNAEVVVMSAYAPLLAHEEGWQWRPDLIWFDNLRSYATPNYYVQQIFATQRGDAVLPTDVRGAPRPSSTQPGLYATASLDRKSQEIILKVVNSAPEVIPAQIEIVGARDVGARGRQVLLTADRLEDENSMVQPTKVAPVTSTFRGAGPHFERPFAPHSVTVLRLKVRPMQ